MEEFYGPLNSPMVTAVRLVRERRQNILGPVSRLVLLRGGGGISKSAKVEAGGPKISQLIKLY